MSKTALIVDDSPLARHVLGQLLADHGIEAATAPSAEEALEFLKHRRPDVVFMDHLMPGMGGFEALEAIKANPATATIPVMMYTSQEGELYVGQARALGAFGVLPKDLKPTEVTQVLRALKLVPGTPGSAAAAAGAGGPPPDPDASQRVKALLEELFYQQRYALREEIREGYLKAIATVQPPPDAGDDRSHARPEKAMWPRAVLLTLGLLIAILGTLYLQASRQLETERQRTAELLERNSELSGLASAAAEAIDARPIVPAQNSFDALEWAVNLSGQYRFGESPLNEQRAQQLNRLVQYLDESGFAGVIALEIHAGRFCMNYGEDGAWALAPDAMPAENCEQVAPSAAEAEPVSNRQSLAFANILAAADRGRGPQIRMSFQGDSQPILPYPALNSFVTAGEWNAVAAINQRIEIRLLQ